MRTTSAEKRAQTARTSAAPAPTLSGAAAGARSRCVLALAVLSLAALAGTAQPAEAAKHDAYVPQSLRDAAAATPDTLFDVIVQGSRGKSSTDVEKNVTKTFDEVKGNGVEVQAQVRVRHGRLSDGDRQAAPQARGQERRGIDHPRLEDRVARQLHQHAGLAVVRRGDRWLAGTARHARLPGDRRRRLRHHESPERLRRPPREERQPDDLGRQRPARTGTAPSSAASPRARIRSTAAPSHARRSSRSRCSTAPAAARRAT